MTYAQRARKLTPLQIRAANQLVERPALIPAAIYTLEEAALVLAVGQNVVDRARFAEGEKRLGYYKIGDSVRFTGAELLRWFQTHAVESVARVEMESK